MVTKVSVDTNKVHRTWTFTQPNYTDEHESFWKSIIVKQITVGREVSESGLKHLQGFVIFTRGYRLSQLKKLQPTAHWEPALATDAANYCLKEGDILRHEVSEKKRQAAEYIWESVKKGKPNVEIYEEHNASIFHYRAIANARSDYQSSNVTWEAPEVFWLWGPTGSGKTRYVYDKYNYNDLSIITVDSGFFSGYDISKRTVLLDDLRPGDIRYSYLLRLLDRYPGQRLRVIGGFIDWKPLRVYITSNQPPSGFAPPGDSASQLERRIKEVTKF